MKFTINRLYVSLWSFVTITLQLSCSSIEDIDRLTAHLHPVAAHEIRKEFSEKLNLSSRPYVSAPKLQLQEGCLSPATTKNNSNLAHSIETANVDIQAIVKNYTNIKIAQKQNDAKKCIAKASIAATGGVATQIINTALQKKRDQHSRVFGFDDAAALAIAGQAAKPLLILGATAGIIYKIEGWIRARDLAYIEKLKNDHRAEQTELLKRMENISAILTITKTTMEDVSVDMQELKAGYNQMEATLTNRIMPKMRQLIDQTTHYKNNNQEAEWRELGSQLAELKIPGSVDGDTENNYHDNQIHPEKKGKSPANKFGKTVSHVLHALHLPTGHKSTPKTTPDAAKTHANTAQKKLTTSKNEDEEL